MIVIIIFAVFFSLYTAAFLLFSWQFKTNMQRYQSGKPQASKQFL